MSNLHQVFVSIIISLYGLAACSYKNPFPPEWESIASDKLKDSWRDESKSRFTQVKCDFNGDGIIDEARLLVRKDGSGFALFAMVSQKDSSLKTYLLDEIRNLNLIQAMGIKKVLPGTYKTACGKGYWDCQKNEAPEIHLKNEAIDYFKIESANSFFYWDIKADAFKRVWTSD